MDAPVMRAATRSGPRGRRRRRWPRRTAVAVVVVLLAGYAGVGWFVSGQVINSLRVPLPEDAPNVDVVAVDDGEVQVVPADNADAVADVDAFMGLRWDGGFAQVGPTTAVSGDVQTRSVELLVGDPPPIGGDVALFHGFAFPTDPAAVGIDVETVTYPSPLGDLEAWYLPGEGTTWLVAVHGRGADRSELLRLVDAVEELRYPTLVITYRNDPGMPSTGDGILLVGQDEWVDVRAAVDHALAEGADDVVLYGASMGGALSLAYVMNEDREVVRGVVLESPLVDLREVVRLRSGEALPVGGPVGDSLLATARFITWLRTGLDFDTIDYVDRADELDVPVLLLHGEDDTSVPVDVATALADARPDLVELHVIPDAAHVRAWNEDPTAFEALVTDFLEEVGRS